MEDPLTADDPVRGGVAAEEDEARAYAEQYLAPASVTVSVKLPKTVTTEILVICTRRMIVHASVVSS